MIEANAHLFYVNMLNQASAGGSLSLSVGLENERGRKAVSCNP